MDFLTFKSFISSEALIIFYYIGALILPISIWVLSVWLMRKYKFLNIVYKYGKAIVWQSLSKQQQTKFIILFVIISFFIELFWRMLFEFLIAYMQIRDVLLQA